MSSGGAITALIYELCPERLDLGARLADDEDTDVPDELGKSAVFTACARSAGRASHALLQLDYFDADYRSNVGATITRRHAAPNLNTHRLVFLRTSTQITDGLNTGQLLGTLADSEILGYMILTPDPIGPIGRSLIPAPLAMTQVRNDVIIESHVRTLVSEQVSIFGNLREVIGVPFLQQDGNLFRCAHASAWMVHFGAVLRGLATRRSMVSFHEAGGSLLQAARQYPSSGLTAWQVANLLEEFGLPCDSLQVKDAFLESRMATWYDRQSLWDLADRVEGVTGLKDEDLGVHLDVLLDLDITKGSPNRKAAGALYREVTAKWTIENLTRFVCQYLNSGFPCIALYRSHSIVITGYLRARDLEPGDEIDLADAEETDVVALIVSDDDSGPYRLEPVSRIAASLESAPVGAALLVPLPTAIWLRGSDAETEGAKFFASSLQKLLDAVDKAEQVDTGGEDSKTETAILYHTTDVAVLEAARTYVSGLRDRILVQKGAELSIRSYVVSSGDFQRGFAHRAHNDPVAVAQVGMASLPKYVWVVEFTDRSVRTSGKPNVIGEVVLDASNLDVKETSTLITHVPGAIQVKGLTGAGKWHVTGIIEPYSSGRFHGTRDWDTSPAAIAARWKNTAR